MKSKGSLFLFHVPVWVIAIFVAWFFSTDSFPGMRSSYTVLSTLVLSFWMLGSFYTFYCFLVPKYLDAGNKRLFWLYAAIFVIIIMPVFCIALLLLTKTSALSLKELLSLRGLLPYLGIVILTLVCSLLGLLYRLLLKRYHT